MEKLYLNTVVSLSGRIDGQNERKKLKLDEKDLDNNQYEIVISNITRTINPSYFLGLFSYSIKNLGLLEFKRKYNFIMENKKDLSEGLKEDIYEGIEWALDDSEVLY